MVGVVPDFPEGVGVGVGLVVGFVVEVVGVIRRGTVGKGVIVGIEVGPGVRVLVGVGTEVGPCVGSGVAVGLGLFVGTGVFVGDDPPQLEAQVLFLRLLQLSLASWLIPPLHQ